MGGIFSLSDAVEIHPYEKKASFGDPILKKRMCSLSLITVPCVRIGVI